MTTDNVDKKREFILGELNTLARKEISREGAKIICPFHADTNPSGNVNLDVDEARAPLGWFRCWSCQHSCSWTELADRLGLRKFSSKKNTAEDYVDPSRYRKGLLDDEGLDEAGGDSTTEDGFEDDFKDLQFFDFQQEDWRTIPVKSLQKLGCKFCYQSRNDTFYIWMPVYINKELQGYVKAHLEKPEPRIRRDRNGKEYEVKLPSYINAPGKWSQSYGLLFFDYAVKLMRRKELSTIVLCEGPRDAIRLLRNGIPAIAVLGASNWNEKKRFQLEKAGADNLILFMDGDDAGKAATKKIYKDVRQHFNTKYMSLWKHTAKNGDKWDPFSCPKRFIAQVKKNLI